LARNLGVSIDVVVVGAAEVLVGTLLTFQAVFAGTAAEFVVAPVTKHCREEGAEVVIVTFLAP
jgi:hypothetical protein